MAPTPAWAAYDPHATDGGFDPAETRYVRKAGAKPQLADFLTPQLRA